MDNDKVLGPPPRFNPLKRLDYALCKRLALALDNGYDYVLYRCYICGQLRSSRVRQCLRCGHRRLVLSSGTTLDLFRVWWKERKHVESGADPAERDRLPT